MSEEVEIIRADPTLQRLVRIGAPILIGILLLALIAVEIYGDPWEIWMARHEKELQGLLKSDPVAGIAAYKQHFRILAAVFVGATFAMVSFCAWQGHKFWVAKQWPPPGTRVFRDTHVLKGNMLRVLGGLFFFVAAAVLAVAMYGGYVMWRMTESTQMKSNPSLEPTVPPSAVLPSARFAYVGAARLIR